MPYNPCGRVVDYGRRPYRTKARFFRDSDLEIDIQWYQVPESAPSLPFPSAVMSNDWLEELYDDPWGSPVGEVWNTPRPYFFKPTPIGLNYAHLCGTAEDFAEGATFDPTRVVEFDEQGLPLCCELPRTPGMGAVMGMEVQVVTDNVPGGACVDAFPMDFDVTYNFAVPGAGQWWHVLGPVTQFESIYVISPAVFADGNPIFNSTQSGADCEHDGPNGTTLVGPDYVRQFVAFDGQFWVVLETLVAVSYTLKVTRTAP